MATTEIGVTVSSTIATTTATITETQVHIPSSTVPSTQMTRTESEAAVSSTEPDNIALSTPTTITETNVAISSTVTSSTVPSTLMRITETEAASSMSSTVATTSTSSISMTNTHIGASTGTIVSSTHMTTIQTETTMATSVTFSSTDHMTTTSSTTPEGSTTSISVEQEGILKLTTNLVNFMHLQFVSGDLTILMVVAGQPTNANSQVELIDMTDQGRTCIKPVPYPGAKYGSEGAFFQNKTIVCGGSPYTPDCYKYLPEQKTWEKTISLNTERALSASTIIQDHWLIGGGANSNGAMKSAEILGEGEALSQILNPSFLPYTDMPAARRFSNLVTYENDKVIMLGDHKSTHILDFNTGTLSNGPDLILTRLKSQGGMVTFANGTSKIVAAGGLSGDTTEWIDRANSGKTFEILLYVNTNAQYSVNNVLSILIHNTF